MQNIHLPPRIMLNPKGMQRAWAAIWSARWEAAVGTMRAETTFLWMFAVRELPRTDAAFSNFVRIVLYQSSQYISVFSYNVGLSSS